MNEGDGKMRTLAQALTVSCAVLVSGLVDTPPAQAASCFAVASRDGTVLEITSGGDTKRLTLEPRQEVAIEDCSSVFIRHGDACFIGGAVRCVEVPEGSSLDPGSLEGPAQDIITRMMAVLTGQEDYYGGTRNTVRLDGFPYGPVLASGYGLWIPARFIKPARPSAFNLTLPSGETVQIPVHETGAGILIPPEHIVPNQTYRWTVRLQGTGGDEADRYEGAFTVEDPASVRIDGPGPAPTNGKYPGGEAIGSALALYMNGRQFELSQVLSTLSVQ